MEPLLRSLRSLSDRRFQAFGAVPLAAFERAGEAFTALPHATVARLHRERAGILALLTRAEPSEQLLAHHVEGFARVCHRHHQFLVLGDAERIRIRDVYGLLLTDLRALLAEVGSLETLDTGLRRVLGAHHRALADLSRELLLAQLGRADMEPVCHEYAPALQLEVLGLRPEALREPVLDLGCGERAGLVAYLRDLGVDAVGLDRAVPPGPWHIAGDWLREPLGRARWGTVLSHMAFSNHFAHHHHRRHGQADLYAHRTMAILQALAPGGRFVYAPGLPFFEDLLPRESYTVQRHPIRSPAAHADPVAYATHVWRRG